MARHAMIGLLLVAGACAGGCGGDKPGAAEIWAGEVCSSLAKSGATPKPPPVDGRDPGSSRDAVVSYLDDASTRLEALEGTLKAKGAPPVADGQDALDRALGSLATTRTAVDDAKTGLAGAKVVDERTLSLALSSAAPGITAVTSYAGPAAELKANPALAEAFDRAGSCEGL